MGLPYNDEVKHRGNLFSLIYGSDALIPVDIGEPNLSFAHFSEKSNNKVVATDLDLLEGRRKMTLIQMAIQQ